MARKKLQKFAELNTLSNVAQINQIDFKEKLNNFLNKDKDLILELACGKGEYSLALAKKFPNKQFIGIDIQGERLWTGAKQALAKKINNVFFLRTQIENLGQYFTKQSISEIWIIFPDPFPLKGQIKKRLTSPRFLKTYQQLLKSNGWVNLKTDDANLFNYSINSVKKFKGNILEQIIDIYSVEHDNLLNIQTYYQKKHLQNNKTIKYLKFSL